MEKKLYIQPALTVVNFEFNTLLAGSTPKYDPTSTFGNEDFVGSRRNTSIWDDDDNDWLLDDEF